MNARAAILGRLRTRLGRDTASAAELRIMEREVAGRLEHPPTHPVPARTRLGDAARRALFVRMAEEAKASVTPLARAAALPESLRIFLKARGLDGALHATGEAGLRALPWAAAGISLRHGRSAGTPASVALAFAGIAETGSLLFCAAPESPMTAHLLCDLHLVLLPENRIFATVEAALEDFQKTQGAFMPSAAMFVTGPSRTADIEQQMQLGAHGPRELHIYLTEEGP